MLFVSLMPVGTSDRERHINLWAAVIGAYLAIMAGWFWLLSATDGTPVPYLVVVAPFALTMLAALLVLLGLQYVGSIDARQIREKGKATLTWKSVVLIILTLGLVIFGPLFVIIAVPRWFL